MELFDLLVYERILRLTNVLISMADAHTCKTVVFRCQIPIESFRTYALSTSETKDCAIDFLVIWRDFIVSGMMLAGNSMWVPIWCLS